MPEQPVSDDESLLRRIPPGEKWFEPPDRVFSANFKLRSGERGLSVYRGSIVSANDVLKMRETIPGSFVVSATAGAVRKLENSAGEPLNLDVLPDNPHDDNPGHALIVGPEPGRLTNSAAKALQRLFKRVE